MKLSSDLLQNVKSEELCKVYNAISSSGFEVRMVGGVVRDLLLGRPCKDVDLSTDAVPETVANILRSNGIRCIETGLQHGTVTAHVNKRDFEITTLRSDELTDGRHAQVKFVNDWKIDAERRDLTINAMSLSLDGTLYDYFDGYSDLMSERVRFVGDTRKRIKEDYLRILRYYRFLARFASPDVIAQNNKEMEDIEQIIMEECSGLQNVSVERIWLELKQILVGPNAPAIVRRLCKCNIFEYSRLKAVKMRDLIEFERAYSNSKRLQNGMITVHPCTLLASLFGTNADCNNSLLELKLSRHDIALTTFIVNNREPISDCTNFREQFTEVIDKLEKSTEEMKDEICTEKYEDLLVLNYKPKEVKTLTEFVTQLILYEGNVNILNHMHDWEIPLFPVGGNDLLAIKIQGKNCGRTLEYLKKIWIKSRFSLTKNELIAQIKDYF